MPTMVVVMAMEIVQGQGGDCGNGGGAMRVVVMAPIVYGLLERYGGVEWLIFALKTEPKLLFFKILK